MLVLEMEVLEDWQHASWIHWLPWVMLHMAMESDMNMEYSNKLLTVMEIRSVK